MERVRPIACVMYCTEPVAMCGPTRRKFVEAHPGRKDIEAALIDCDVLIAVLTEACYARLGSDAEIHEWSRTNEAI
jgi:predicted kinase